MTAIIVNGAPMTIFYGTEDSSTRELVPVPEVRPTHLPMVWSYTKKGPLLPQVVVGDSLVNMYGADSFDPRSKWATHQTVLANIVNAAGNSIMLQRMQPADAPLPATIRLYADVLPTKVDVTERNADGSIKLDDQGDPVTTGQQVDGYKVKYVVQQVNLDISTGESTFGVATILPGDQTDSTTSVQSQLIPLFDLEVSDFGSYGNDLGWRWYAPTLKSSSPLDDRLIINQKVYPFRMAFASRPDANTTSSLTTSQRGETYINVCLKPNTDNPYTVRDLYVGDALLPEYKADAIPGMPVVYGPFGRMGIYQDNIDTLLNQFYVAEKPFIDQFSDFDNSTDEAYRFNLVSGVSSQNVPYHSFVLIKDQPNSVVLTENSTLFALGGGDGTMNETAFAALVSTAVSGFADPTSYLLNTAKYPVSHAYDTGFPLDTKYAMTSFIAIRKDTMVLLSTYDVNGVAMSAADESSLGIALKTRLQMFPESDYYGTPTMRGMVITQYGNRVGTTYRKKLPLTLHIAERSAAYMGAGNQVWDGTERFDRSPGSIITGFTGINETYTPANVRNKDWAAGMVRALDYDRTSVFFPALKTVYDNDTSVLNSYFTVCAIMELEKIGEQVWREITGSSDLTQGQIIKFVQDSVNTKTAALGNFDSRFTIIPVAYFTDADVARGYSYTLRIDIYAPNLITVGSLTINARRISDLTVGQ